LSTGGWPGRREAFHHDAARFAVTDTILFDGRITTLDPVGGTIQRDAHDRAADRIT
jgi:hypothetical protein